MSANDVAAAVGRRRVARQLVPVLLACLPALAAIRGGLIWTDVPEIAEGGLIRSGAALARALLLGIDGQYYRPTVVLFHSIEHALFGPSAFAFRATNFAIHVGNA